MFGIGLETLLIVLAVWFLFFPTTTA